MQFAVANLGLPVFIKQKVGLLNKTQLKITLGNADYCATIKFIIILNGYSDVLINNIITSHLYQLTSETDAPCFTITTLPEDLYTFSANQLHSNSSATNAYAATYTAPYACPPLLSPYVPYLSTPSDSDSSLSQS